MRKVLMEKLANILKNNNKEFEISSIEIFSIIGTGISFVIGDYNIYPFINCPEKLSKMLKIDLSCSDGYWGHISDEKINNLILDVIKLYDSLVRE